MTKKVFALDTKPGIQRDGTTFDADSYADGRWVRFQRARPRKVGGYRQITGGISGPSRGIYVNPQQSFNNVFNGHSKGLQVVPIDNNGVGSGVTDLTLSNFTASDDNLWQFDTFYDVSGSGDNLLLAHPGQSLTLIDNNVNTPVWWQHHWHKFVSYWRVHCVRVFEQHHNNVLVDQQSSDWSWSIHLWNRNSFCYNGCLV